MKTLNVLGIDIGASHGRGYCGAFDGDTLTLREIHRFPNQPVAIHASIYWEILSLFNEVKNCVLKTKAESIPISALGIDTWSQDFGILDNQGNLLGNPHTYRDSRTEQIFAEIGNRLTTREVFARTGMHAYPFGTLFQLISMKSREKVILDKADKLLFIPNLLSYFCSGGLNCDSTLASVSLLYSPLTHTWLDDFLSRFELPLILPDIRTGCGVIGNVTGSFQQETGCGMLPVISVIQHDTASTAFTVPVESMEEIIFISSGTWSVLGTMIGQPILSEAVYHSSFNNELAYDNQTMLLQNITGLWILQECAREWSQEGYSMDYPRMEEIAMRSSFSSSIDPDHPEFARPGNMTAKINSHCQETGQPAPQNKEETYQCIVNGLACKYAQSVNELKRLLNKEFQRIYITGGGARNGYLCSQTARLTGMDVVAATSRATVVGNILSQLMVLGEIRNRSEAVEVIQRSFPISIYSHERN